LDQTQDLCWGCLPPSRMAEDLQSQKVLFVLKFTTKLKIELAISPYNPINARLEKHEINRDLDNP
jgi:hypothetical protein